MFFMAWGFALNVYSQTFIIGKVEDAFLQTPLPEAKVSLLLAADSTVVVDSIPVRKKYRKDGTIREAQFTLTMEKNTCNYLLHATLNGYEDGWLPLSIDGNGGGVLMLDEPLTLRRVFQRKLDEVTVTATKVKMYWKGDTLVYDATAFRLPDGSMLDDLIRQMPGVTMNDAGETFVGGRKRDELQLGSRLFMRGNSKVLLENLPYYTVKDIKVYEQDTDLNRAAGMQVEEKKYVMDVSLKPEYQLGYVANVEAAGGTQERWLGRAFLLGFTPRTRYTLLGNSNNVNESRHIGSSGYWTPGAMPRSLLTTHSVAGEIDYQSLDKNVQETLNVDFTSTRNEGKSVRRSELFLPDNPLQAAREESLAKAGNLKVGNRFRYVRPKGLMFETDASFSYAYHSGNSFMLTNQFVDSLTVRQHTVGLSDGKNWDANLKMRILPTLGLLKNKYQYLRIAAHIDYASDENQRVQGFRTEDFVCPSFAASYNSADYSKWKFAVSTPVSYALDGRLNYFSIEAAPSYSQDRVHDWLYHPDTLLLPSQLDMLQAITDHRNSYHSDLQSVGGDITLHLLRRQMLPATGRQPEMVVNFLDFYLKMKPMHERLHYQRGVLDTLAIRNTVRFEPWLDIQFYIKRDYFRPVTLRVGYYESNFPLVNQIAFRDDATPLVVRLGNPDLKPWRSETYISAGYKDNRSVRHNYNLWARLGYVHNDISQSIRFNPITSVYTYRPENTHGNYDVQTKVGIFYTLDADGCWTMENNFDGKFNHWLDHVMLEGDTESRQNAVNTLTLHDRAYIQYNRGALNLRATGDVTWRHSESRMRGFETLNATDFHYGLSARYTLPRLNMTLTADATMYSRRGYGSAELNTDDFVLNASLSQPFLKGKLVARIEAFDLLHQVSSTQYAVSAQGRTETWYRSLPHYVMLHLVYHWNKNPKKR